ncbi:sex pheromone biosynthesis protein [Solibacillus silvestris StLB046]|uniref:Sex pheromone biosynthesis protein n=1 Tax=Solibacillus silvestris (strain StLB046) TaxID=1002809 RepID=F2F101_SOLSS|nr:FxLYD domain-containing protein [Solibacillus silvestris]BAK16796.1 sex pheromone biosynthesis protein [Solibacillus silvestris StLB046]
MKKITILLITLLFILSACGDSKQTISQSAEKESQSENSEETTQAKEKVNAKLEIEDSGSTIWSDSIDSIWINTAAIFRNTGEVPVDIGETQMNYKGKDGSILGTSTMIYAVPEIVQPGESAMIVEGTTLNDVTSLDNYSETTFNFNFDATEEDSNLMEVSAVKGIPSDYGYSVTGIVKNPTDVQQEDIRLAAILYDENGKILGGLSGSVDVGLAAGGEAGFELSYPPLPDNIGSKVNKIEVKSYGFTW